MRRGEVCIEILISELLPHKIAWKLKKIYITNYYLLMVDQTIWSGFLEFTFKKSFGDSNVCAGLGQDSFPRVQPY